jgi:hypothetical protein
MCLKARRAAETRSLDQTWAPDIQNVLSGSCNGSRIIGFAAFEVALSELLDGNRLLCSPLRVFNHSCGRVTPGENG